MRKLNLFAATWLTFSLVIGQAALAEGRPSTWTRVVSHMKAALNPERPKPWQDTCQSKLEYTVNIAKSSSADDNIKFVDPENDDFFAKGTLDEDGVLNLHFVLQDDRLWARWFETRSDLRGAPLFDEIIRHFGSRVKAIRGRWYWGDNLRAFQSGLNRGLSVEEAAQQTWTGRQAARHGFKLVESVEETDDGYIAVFVRPRQ